MNGIQNPGNYNQNFNNQSGMNQIMINSNSNINGNNLFNQNIQNTWQYMLPNN